MSFLLSAETDAISLQKMEHEKTAQTSKSDKA